MSVQAPPVQNAGNVVQAPSPAGFIATSEETLTMNATASYLKGVDPDANIDLSEIRDRLLNRISAEFTIETTQRNADKRLNNADHPKLVKPKALDEFTVATVLLALYQIRAISLAEGRGGSDLTLLGMYDDDPQSETYGCYVTDESPMVRLAYELKPSLTSKGVESLLKTMKAHAPVVNKTTDAHLIPVKNGVFNHDTQELMDFSSEYVFLTKSPVRYVADAPNPVLIQPDGTPWDIETWMEQLSDDEGVPELLWELVSAHMRPGVRWNKAAFLYSNKGNNGKGTFCMLPRNLLGPEGHASIPIAKFGEQFAKSELVHARAVIVDENPVGAFSKDMGDFKSVVTGDRFTLERKYKDPLSISFSGMVTQCVNDFPKSRDRSASYTRRQLFIPFRKWFGGDGVERKYIKDDYLARTDVLEYALRRVLQMTHTELSNPPASQELLSQFQRENNPVRDFWLDHDEEFVWDLLPTPYLYDLFVAWFRKNHPSGIPVNRNEFVSQLVEVISETDEWDFSDPQKKHRPGLKMSEPEPMVMDYDLKDWMNTTYNGKDWKSKAYPAPQRVNYRGVVRTRQTIFAPSKDDDDS